jgi:hypothetical protein
MGEKLKVAAIQKELDAEYLNSNGNNGSSTSGCLVKQHVSHQS